MEVAYARTHPQTSAIPWCVCHAISYTAKRKECRARCPEGSTRGRALPVPVCLGGANAPTRMTTHVSKGPSRPSTLVSDGKQQLCAAPSNHCHLPPKNKLHPQAYQQPYRTSHTAPACKVHSAFHHLNTLARSILLGRHNKRVRITAEGINVFMH